MGEGGGMLIVEGITGRPIGTVSWHGVAYGPNPESRAWNIGITLSPDANHAEQRALTKAGFVAEGVQRGAQFRGDAWLDLVTFALIRQDRERR